MLAGVLFTAIGFGVIAAIAALTISGSFWAAFAAYSLTGMAILLLTAAFVGFRGNRPPPTAFATVSVAAAARN